MRTNLCVLTSCLVIFAPILTSMDLSAARSAPPKPAPAKKAAAKDAPLNVSVVSEGGTATLPDPKRPGKLLYELHYRSASGQSGDTGAFGTLTSVWGRLFQAGVASAILTAPQAQVNSPGKSVTVTGLGGVVVKSLTQSGTRMTADTVVWTAGLNRIVASGHVVYRDGKSGLVLTGPRMNFDTRLKSFQMGRGHGTMNL